MTPFLYAADERMFTSGGLGLLTDCISCEVTEERNGVFECEFRYPVNGDMFPKIKPGCIIYTTYDASNTPEPFDIYGFSVDINGIATFRAHHISYRLNKIVYGPAFSHSGWMSASTAIWRLMDFLTEQSYWHTHENKLPNNISYRITNSGYSSDTSSPNYDGNEYHIYSKSNSLREVLIGGTKSITLQSGAEMKWSYSSGTITGTIMRRRGTDTSTLIRFGDSLTGMTYDYDETDYSDEIIPYVITNDGSAKLLTDLTYSDGTTRTYISVPGYKVYGDRFTATLVDFSSYVTYSSTTGEPTADAVVTAATDYYNSHNVKSAYENLTINYLPLWQSGEYEYIEPAQKLKLCDTAVVMHPTLGLNKRMKVTKTKWNPLLERYTGMEFGSVQRTIFTVNNGSGTKEEAEQDQYIVR